MMERRLTADLFAVALATRVLSQPGGPCSNTPVTEPGPMAAYCSGWGVVVCLQATALPVPAVTAILMES